MAVEVVIVGGGKVGADIAGLVMADGHAVRLIEQRPDRATRLRASLPGEVVVEGSGTDPLVLERAGVRRADVLVAVTGLDETNLVAASLARFEYAVPRTIGRVNDPRNAWLFTPLMGVDEALNQADLVARLIVEEMSLSGMVTLLKLHKGEYSLVEERIEAGGAAAGVAVRDLVLPALSVLAGVVRGGELIPPRGETVLWPGDEVLAVVHAEARAALAEALGPGVASG